METRAVPSRPGTEPPAPADALVVLVTVPARDAEAIARTLVAERLAACVNELPGVRSTYIWQGAVESSEEVLLLVKTTGAALAALEERVRSLHPYQVPEVLALPVAAGSGPYLEWLKQSVTPA